MDNITHKYKSLINSVVIIVDNPSKYTFVLTECWLSHIQTLVKCVERISWKHFKWEKWMKTAPANYFDQNEL